MIDLALVSNAKLLTDTLGLSPEFHDSELNRIVIDRIGPCITLEITTVSGFEVKFDCSDIDDLELKDFNHQNVIHSIVITEQIQTRFASGNVELRKLIAIESVFGATCRFSANMISVRECRLKTTTVC